MIKLIVSMMIIAFAITSTVAYTNSSDQSSTEIESTIAPTSSTRRFISQKELKDARKRRRKFMHSLSHAYEHLYFKLSPETYEKIKKASDECNQQLELATDEVKMCTEKRMQFAPRNRYIHPKPLNKKNIDAVRMKQGRTMDNEIIPGTVYEEEETTPVESSATSAVTTQQSVSKPTTSLALEIEQRAMSWRDIFAEQKSRNKCYFDKVMANGPAYKNLTRDELREAREDSLIQLGLTVWECIDGKFDQ